MRHHVFSVKINQSNMLQQIAVLNRKGFVSYNNFKMIIVYIDPTKWLNGSIHF